MTVKLYSMDDIGSRAEHMADLHDLWSFAYGQLTTDRYHSGNEDIQAKELEIALNLLVHHMESEYRPTTYAQVINNLPKDAAQIPDDRIGGNNAGESDYSVT